MTPLLRSPSQLVNPLARQRFLGFGTAPGGAAFVGVLDAYTANLAGAWSVSRRLLSSYNGPLLRVRRDDAQELDIGATSSGELDASALLSFCGSGGGFVRTVYSQTGTGVDFGMSVAAAQPIIVTSGAIETLNGKPAMRVTGLQCLDSAFAGGGAAAMTVFSAGATAANAGGRLFARYLAFGETGQNDYQSVNRWVPLRRNVADATYCLQFNGTTTALTGLADGTNFVVGARIQAANPVRYLKINGLSAVTENTAATPSLSFNLSRWFKGISASDGVEHWAGKGSELLAYTTAQSDPTVIMGVVNTHFGIYS